MSRASIHPAVRRGTFWWRLQMMVLGGIAAAITVLTLQDPSPARLVMAVVAIVVSAIFSLFAIKQIEALRHEYEYAKVGLEKHR
ncbi:hypothetical protein ACX80U_09810 [Arthrobacter sp. TmT3-37]